MKKTLLLAVACLTIIVAFPQDKKSKTPAGKTTPAAKTYTCPMHPDVVSDKPGKCPKCGMQLQLKSTGKGHKHADSTHKM
jgi:hypothetical protein